MISFTIMFNSGVTQTVCAENYVHAIILAINK